MTLPKVIYAWPWEVNPSMGQWESIPSIVGEGAKFIALDAPELVALVESSKGLLFAHDHGNGLEGWHNTRERLRVALTAWEALTASHQETRPD